MPDTSVATPATLATPAPAVAVVPVVAPVAAAPAVATPAAPRLLGDPVPAAKAEAVADPKAADPAKPGEPAKPVEWTLAAPKDSPITADRAKAIESFAKTEGISQAQAEKMLAREAAEISEVGKAWQTQTMAHPEIGGANYDATIENANRALNAFATPEERKAILGSEFRKNPIFLAILNRAAKGLTREDIVIPSSPAPAAPLSAAERIYGRR